MIKKILLIVSCCFLMIGCTKTSDIDQQEQLITRFYEAYEVSDFEEMMKYVTDSFVDYFFHEGDVCGNASASLIEFDRNLNVIRGSETWIYTSININPVPESSLYGEVTTSLFVVVKMINGEWIITGLETG